MTGPDLDVLIIGAGVSGIGIAACLGDQQPARTYAILDAREDIGGTWDLFRYPGVRSDSDLHTYAYRFKPWTNGRSLADGPAIMNYLREAVRDFDVEAHIRFGHKVTRAEWSSENAAWTVHAERGPEAEPVEITARWLVWGGGYYRYDRGYSPDIPGLERFGGWVVHPQHWPDELDHAGKRIVIIGSGATAITLVPELSRTAKHVTMLQRTPTYMLALPETDPVYQLSAKLLGPERAHRITRSKNLCLDNLSYRFMRRFPKRSSKILRSWIAKALPEGYDVETHFNPPYNPWDQRLCAVLGGDLFEAISAGRGSVVTGRIREVTRTGIVLESGEMVEADIIVTATGLDMVPLGGLEYRIDRQPVDVSKTVSYKSMMLSGVPNLVYAFGYTNASWTLKIDLVAQHLCRLLRLMDEREYDVAVPDAPGPDQRTSDMFELTSGYVRRSAHRWPRRGETAPWIVRMDYSYDRAQLLDGPVGDHMRFSRTSTDLVTTCAAGNAAPAQEQVA